MLKAGMCSVTLSTLSVEDVIATACKADLSAIEWWGTGHVPHGDLETAARVRALTEEASLETSSYGSYYRAGVSEADGLTFQSVLDTAVVLGTPTIRVWAGNKDSGQAGSDFIQTVIDDTNRIADMAADKGVSITFEYHGGSLTDRNQTAIRFSSQVPHPNVFFSWQPPHGYSLDHCLEGLEGLLPRLSTVHVYHWTIGSYEKNTVNETIRPLVFPDAFHRHPLAAGTARWQRYIKAIGSAVRDHALLLEFVKDNTPDQVVADAATLKHLLSSANSDACT